MSKTLDITDSNKLEISLHSRFGTMIVEKTKNDKISYTNIPFERSELTIEETIKKLIIKIYQLHRCGIIHGSLNRNSVLLYGKHVFISQFEHSRYSDNEFSQIKTYESYTRAPENWTSPATFKTDIWALGCIIFEIVYSRKMFNDIMRYNDEDQYNLVSNFALCELTCSIPNKSKRKMKFTLPRDWFSDKNRKYDELIIKCLHCDPNMRPSCEELLTLLDIDIDSIKQIEI